MSDKIESQIERFAPGFRNTILARCSAPPPDLERRNANMVGGDIIRHPVPIVGYLAFR
jgi:phytoene dehydrogenase-like protein